MPRQLIMARLWRRHPGTHAAHGSVRNLEANLLQPMDSAASVPTVYGTSTAHAAKVTGCFEVISNGTSSY
jgi:hypothetical protein